MMYQGRAIKRQSGIGTKLKRAIADVTISFLFIMTILIAGSEEFANFIITIIGG